MLHLPMRTACLALILACGLAPSESAARPLRVLTYNIHHAQGRDGDWDLERIASVINAANPDLVALQEVDQGTARSGADVFQLDELARLTGMNGRFGKTINHSGGQYGNGVLLGTEFTVRNVLNHALPNPADGEPRRVMELRLQYSDAGATARLNFFATHFDHSSGDNRQAQVEFVNDLVAGSRIPSVLAGDLNFRPSWSAYDILTDQWTDPTAANPGRDPAVQIDYVVYRNDEQWSVVHPGRFIVNPTTQVASDHYPVLAVLELVPANADFDADGDVDGADLLTWQRHQGPAAGARPGDANHDQFIDAADRAVWSEQFTAAAAPAQPIPEPAQLALVPAAAALLTPRRRARSAP